MADPIEAEFHAVMNQIAQVLDQAFNGEAPPPPQAWQRKVGFVLLSFETGRTEGGRVNYISNCDRAEMIAAMTEWLARAKGQPMTEGRA